MVNKKFDLIILGSGSGGIASAIRAAHYGAQVAVVEKAHIGGACLNLGCVPKKIMFNASMLAGLLNKSQDYGFSPVTTLINWSLLVSKRNAYIERLREIYEKRYLEHGVTQLHGHGRFIKQDTIEVNGDVYTAPHIIIATGGKPTPLNIPGNSTHLIQMVFLSSQQNLKALLLLEVVISVWNW